MICLRAIFGRIDREAFRKLPGFVAFVESCSYWLHSYCLWSAIKDESESPTWPDYASLKPPNVLTDSLDTEINNHCLFHAWIQYQCHLQLSAVSQYAVANRVVLSCFLTIGQSRSSADCWCHPELFDMNYTIGSPPDFFSFHGQNWFYPAWNWDAMRSDDFQWLRNQVAHRERYFHAAMFDHPLGLFRCWIIPANTDNPLFGHFVPSIPVGIKDLQDMQIGDISRLCRPIFPINDVLAFPLPELVAERLINALATCENGTWRFRSCFESDRDVTQVLDRFKQGVPLGEQFHFDLAKKFLLSHFEGVCLIPDFLEPHRKFYPRYSMTDSTVFNSLPEREAHILYQLFVDFYYRTNIALWHEQGHEKLSVLASSKMHIFGYDLGVSLSDEEKALHRVGICSCHVQRIPRDAALRFDVTSSFPYLSVCTPSSHDLPHLAVWWNRDQADAQQFYHEILKMEGTAPKKITPEITEGILNFHLDSNSMWCIFRFEDLIGLSPEFEPELSTGDLPSFDIGQLIDEHAEWTQRVAEMVEEHHRGRRACPKSSQ
jgi:4-alpha-glucanotransferase